MGFDQNIKGDEKDAMDYSRHEQVALQTAREGIVLLRNEDQILPLSKDQNILIVGRYVETNILAAALVKWKAITTIAYWKLFQSQFSNISYSKNLLIKKFRMLM